jgi:glycosyltransferase involved in cell wall biosynthesis
LKVLVSNRASLPEVVGDAGVSIDALDVNEWVENIARIANDEQLQATLGKQSLKRAELFSWEALAKTYLKAYRESLA